MAISYFLDNLKIFTLMQEWLEGVSLIADILDSPRDSVCLLLCVKKITEETRGAALLQA